MATHSVVLAATAETTAAPSPTSFNTSSTPSPTTTTSIPLLSLAALTTPYIPPVWCNPVPLIVWTTATAHITKDGRNTTETYPNYLLPDMQNRLFTGCQPSGWDSVETRGRFSFSPAVCPSGWGYSVLSDRLPKDMSNTATVTSTARCCPSGFSFLSFYNSDATGIAGPYCMSVSTPSPQPQPHHTTSTSGSTSTGISTSGSSSERNSESSSESTSRSSSTAPNNATTTQPPATLLYPAWNIVWEQQDASALSPEPPVLSVEKTVPTWEPGTTIDESFKRRLTDGSAFGRSIAKGIIGIVVGTVAGILIVAGISFFFILRNKKRNRRLQEAIELQERYDSSRRDRVPDEPLPIYPSQGTHDNTVHIAGHQPGAQSHLPPYKERASEDSGDHNRYRDDCPGGEDTSRGHERQSSGNSSATLDGNERSQRGNGERDAGDTTRPSQTTDDITTVRQS